MSDEVYDADGDINRYLQIPSPEAHVLVVPDGGEPVATTHVGAPAPQHVASPVQGGSIALPTAPPPPPLNPSMAFGNDGQNGNAMAMADAVVPLQGQFGFAAAAAAANADGVQAVPAADSVLQELGSLSLYDDDHYSLDDGDNDDDHYFMDDEEDDFIDALIKSLEDAGGNSNDISAAAGAEHSVFPVQEDITWVPIVHGQLDCSNCRPVRQVLHENANHKLYFFVHDVGEPAGTFQHAIMDRSYIDASGQTILNELMYADLRERTHGCVQNFITNCVEMLKNDTSGKLTDSDSCSTSHQANSNAMHAQLEIDMLKEILSAPSSNAENTNGADDIVLLNAAYWPVASPPIILESSQVAAQNGMSASRTTTGYESELTKQRRRISQMSMKDIVYIMHMSMKDAAKELEISDTAFKRLCRKNKIGRWPARKISSLENKIKKLEEAARRNVGMKGLLAIKEKIDMLNYEKAQIYASVWKVIQENQKNQKKNNSAGGSNAS